MKKRIAQTVMALLLLVSIFFLSREGAQLANGTPKESKGIIVVDSGHGGIDPGVIGQNELKEKEINLALESVAEANRCMKVLPFEDVEMIQLSVSRAKKIGSYQMMMGENPITIFSATGKKEEKEEE